MERFGRLDCAVNNAGIGNLERAPTADYSEENFDRVIEVNLKSVWLCMKYELGQIAPPKERRHRQRFVGARVGRPGRRGRLRHQQTRSPRTYTVCRARVRQCWNQSQCDLSGVC